MKFKIVESRFEFNDPNWKKISGGSLWEHISGEYVIDGTRVLKKLLSGKWQTIWDALTIEDACMWAKNNVK